MVRIGKDAGVGGILLIGSLDFSALMGNIQLIINNN